MSRKLNVVELYAGLARTWEGFRHWKRCQLGLLVDSNQLAVDNYTDNYPSSPYLRRNLQWMKSSEIESAAGGKVDILLACPPCQGFSDTGKRDPDDPRNIHINIFGSFVVGLKPLAVAMENVPLLAASRQFRLFTSRLEQVGYIWTSAIINAALYGSCQTRQRLLFIAFRDDLGVVPSIPAATHGGTKRYFGYHSGKLMTIPTNRSELLGITPATLRLERDLARESALGSHPIPTVGERLSGLPMIGTANAVVLSHSLWQTSATMIRRMSRVPEGGRWRGGKDHFSHAYGRLHRRGFARTITTYFANPGSGRFWHYSEDRPLTIREAARIQGFEDDFCFHGPDSGIARLVGNALDSAIARTAYLAVRKGLD